MQNPESDPKLEHVRHELRVHNVPKDTPNPLRSGIHSRGYLPHVKCEGASYFVTFRLADSLPQEVLIELKRKKAEQERRLEPVDSVGFREAELDYRRNIERYLDRGMGECHLRRPEIAKMVCDSLLHYQGRQYVLQEWVVMPNHVHLIIWPMPNFTLSEILKGRKTYTARHANEMLDRTGNDFWQTESYDHWIRNDEEKSRMRRYIRNNPVTAGLCRFPEDWLWGSAGMRPTKPGSEPA